MSRDGPIFAPFWKEAREGKHAELASSLLLIVFGTSPQERVGLHTQRLSRLSNLLIKIPQPSRRSTPYTSSPKSIPNFPKVKISVEFPELIRATIG
jgi:hypothetical protein